MSQPVQPTQWNPSQRRTLFAGVGSWALDAFDFFVLVFVLTAMADEFKITIVTASLAITFTLIMRPIGALIFGPLAEKFGRKPVLVANIVIFAAIELATAASPNFTTFFILRVVYGIAMGGVWGVASALTMETIPRHARGMVSGLFQAGYPLGYLIASIVYGLFSTVVGWRGMFAIGALPVLLAVYIFFKVDESPVWLASRGVTRTTAPTKLWPAIVKNWPILLFAIILMAAFNYFSHGTQDIYPTFLKLEHGFAPSTVSIIAICYNIAAILGGLLAGTLSERFGRKRIIIIFAALALPCIPLWAFATGSVALGIGAFLVQFMVQGAWGVIPAYLNELVPEGTRAVLPGFVYQLGNVIAAPNATIQTLIATSSHNNYGLALAVVAGSVAVIIVVLMSFSRETRGRDFTPTQADSVAAGA
ncbi:MAG: transporter, family, lactate transporter [Microbacteriaceae bacterium]|jgi:SHS family lactate transporter-like MFS transporter|nr:transporter, family, lactate transporter [Microbacteriaceae bacterium]